MQTAQMNLLSESSQVFDPNLSSLFFQQDTITRNKISNTSDCRELFFRLNQSEYSQNLLFKAYEFVIKGLKETERLYSSSMSDIYSKNTLASLDLIKPPPFPKSLITPNNINCCIQQFAPVQLTQPCWLQNTSQISSCKTNLAVQLMSVYLQITRTEQGEVGLLESFCSMLLASGTKIPVMHSVYYSQQTSMVTEMFDFASTQLALARFPRVLFPEILGFSLAYCQLPSFMESCFPGHQLSRSFVQLHQQRVEKQCTPLLKCITQYLEQFPDQSVWHRIQKGFFLYQLKMQQCREQFIEYLEKPLSTPQQIAYLLQNKSVAAIGHHKKIELNGKSLDTWFAGLPDNSPEFLQALIQSPYVNRENPAESKLLKLFEFEGPMYGVLNIREKKVLKNGLLDLLKADQNKSTSNHLHSQQKPVVAIKLPAAFKSTRSYEKLNTRELYYYLVNADLFPDVLPIAHDKIKKQLRYCALFNPPPFKHYNHRQFDTFIEQIYREEINAYKPLKGIPKTSKAAYIWGIEQIAPMILIDGCWLQNSLRLENINSQIAEILFVIYCDEIGNGRQEQNHPYIFKQLLDSLSIEVPAVHSTEFIQHPGFINWAFDLPVYMLSLSNFTVEYLPELLGLNMAIEVSGLGKGYLSLIDEWTYWGIDPKIASIHISIDNYASGHTFLAKKVIQYYMDDILKRTGDQQTLNKHWKRIYCGYASLRFVGGRFKMSLPVYYLIHKLRAKTD